MSDTNWGAIVGGVAQMFASAQADAAAGKITEQQFQLLKDQLARVAGVPLPELERVVAQQLSPSAVAAIRRDDGLRDKQMQALGAYQDIADSGGMTLDDKVAEEAALSQADSADRRRRATIMAELASRGQANSGNALVASLASAQDAANRGRQSGQESAARAAKRKMEALDALAGGSGRLREQDFGEERTKASAQDEINRYNAASREKAYYHNAGLAQQQFNNQITKATGQANGTNNLASAYGNEAQGVRNQGAAMGQATYNASKGINWGGGDSNDGSGSYDWGDGNASEDSYLNENDDD